MHNVASIVSMMVMFYRYSCTPHLRSMDGDAAFTFGSHFNSSNGEKETQRRRHILAPMSYTWQNDVGRDIRYCGRRAYRSDNGAMHTEQNSSIGFSWGFRLLRTASGIAHVLLRYCLAFWEVKTARIDVTQMGIEIKVIENILPVTVGVPPGEYRSQPCRYPLSHNKYHRCMPISAGA